MPTKKHFFNEMFIAEIQDFLEEGSTEIIMETGFSKPELATLKEIVESISRYIEFHAQDADTHEDMRLQIKRLERHRHIKGDYTGKPEE